ncbi:MAG: hypothetical protein ABJB74_17285 [Gemmatimonas sp.]
MSWLSTIFTAIVTAAIGTAVSGYFANLAVRWYRVSGFEGGSGYFVVGLALCGLVAGLIVGLIISRMVAGSAHPSLLWALLYSAAVILIVTSLAAGTARLVADIPPTIDGERVLLHVEARWPVTRAGSPANTPGVALLDLGASTFFRKQEPQHGPLWKEDAHKVDGRWTVSGVVPMVTSRGTPVIAIALNDAERVSFTMPKLPHPTAKDSAWSAWIPTAGQSGATGDSSVTYRYRVLKLTEPVRTENVGDFAVSAIVNYFKPGVAENMTTLDFYATYRITSREKSEISSSAQGDVASLRAAEVAVLPEAAPGTRASGGKTVGESRGHPSTLLVAVNSDSAGSYWALITSENGRLHEQRIARYQRATPPAELTNIPQRMEERRHPWESAGRVDYSSYTESRLLLFDGAVLNIGTREIHAFTSQSAATFVPSVPPLGVSTDAHSFARFASGQVGNPGISVPMLAITNFVRDTVYELPVDPSRMRYSTLDDLNTEWLAHHFEWKRDARGDERLEVRKDFVPIPYHGTLVKDTNDRWTYVFTSGGQPVRQVLVDFLKAEFQATGDTSDGDAYEQILHLGQDSVSITTPGEVVRLASPGSGSASELVARIGKAFNAALASGKYDSAFRKR